VRRSADVARATTIIGVESTFSTVGIVVAAELHGLSVSTVDFFENVGQRIELDGANSAFNY